MYPQPIVLFSSVASILASGAWGSGIYNPPKGESFMKISIQAAQPVNTSTTDGLVVMFPVHTGDVKGQFNGQLVANISAVTERLLPGSDGNHSAVVTNWILEDDNGDHVFARLQGQTTYGTDSLHGFGFANLATEIEDLSWINWATFLIEWEGQFNTGRAEFEFFDISSGGRKDGKPIAALQPNKG